MNTRQKYGRGASHANPVVPTAKKPDQQAKIPGGRLATSSTTPQINHAWIKEEDLNDMIETHRDELEDEAIRLFGYDTAGGWIEFIGQLYNAWYSIHKDNTEINRTHFTGQFAFLVAFIAHFNDIHTDLTAYRDQQKGGVNHD